MGFPFALPFVIQHAVPLLSLCTTLSWILVLHWGQDQSPRLRLTAQVPDSRQFALQAFIQVSTLEKNHLIGFLFVFVV